MAKINVKDTEITILSVDERDYISLTDMANAKESESRTADIIKNWIRTRYTLEFLGTWEQINNPNFKVVEFDHFKTQAGLPSFIWDEENQPQPDLFKAPFAVPDLPRRRSEAATAPKRKTR